MAKKTQKFEKYPGSERFLFDLDEIIPLERDEMLVVPTTEELTGIRPSDGPDVTPSEGP